MNPLEWTLVKKALALFGAPVSQPDHARVSKHLGGHVAPGTQPAQRVLPKSRARRGASYNRVLFSKRAQRADRKP